MTSDTQITARLPFLAAVMILSLFPAQILAQGLPLKVTVTIVPPYSPLLADWEAHPERVQLLVQNLDMTQAYDFRLAGVIQNEDRSVYIRTKAEALHRMFTIAPGGIVPLSGNDWGLFNQNLVEGQGIDRDRIARLGRLPEGEYTACAQAFDWTSRAPLSAPSPEGCQRISISFGDAPLPIAPGCGSHVDATQPQSVLFQWSPSVVGVPAEEVGMLRYELLVVPVPADKTPEAAMEAPGGPPFLRVTDLTTPMYLCTDAQPVFQAGVRYAWCVTVSDLNSRLAFRNRGRSEVCSFVYSRSGGVVDDQFAGDAGNLQPCTSRCDAAPVEAVPGTQSLVHGASLAIGHFTLRLGDVSGSPSGLSGNGTILIPFLNEISVPVQFTDLQVNAGNEVFAGTAIAVKDAGFSYPETWRSRMNASNSISESEIIATAGQVAMNRLSSENPGATLALPIGFDRTVAGERHVICIVGAVFSPDKATLNALMQSQVPWLNDGPGLSFFGNDICIHRSGPATGFARLHIAANWSSHAEDAYSPNFTFKRSTAPDSGTAVRWGCQGYESFSLQVDMQLSRARYIPVDDRGVPISGNIKVSYVTTSTESISDIVATSSSSGRFALPNVNGCFFSFKGMIWDESVTRAAGTVGMTDVAATADWRGFLPSDCQLGIIPLTNFTSQEPALFPVTGMLITGLGVQLARCTAGTRDTATGVGGWGMIGRSATLALTNSKVTEGRLDCDLLLPVSNHYLKCYALLASTTQTKWSFTIPGSQRIRNTLWGGYITVVNGSVTLGSAGDVAPWIVECGIKSQLSLYDVSIPAYGAINPINHELTTEFTIDKLLLRNQSPYISFGVITHSNDATKKNILHGWDFDPHQITLLRDIKAGTETNPDRFDLREALKIRLPMNILLVADTRILIRGGLIRSSNKPWHSKFLSSTLEKCRFNANLNVFFQVEGELNMFDGDAKYGNGWQGQINGSLLGKGSIAGILLVGNVQGFKYWYSDLRVMWSAGRPNPPTPLFLHGVNGGLWWRMRVQDTSGLRFPIDNAQISNAPIGTGLSGFRYVPDKGASLGMKCILTYAIPMDLGKFKKGKPGNKWDDHLVPKLPKMVIIDGGLSAVFGNSSPYALRQLTGNLDLFLLTLLDKKSEAPFKARGTFTSTGWTHWSGSLAMKAGLPFNSDPATGDRFRFSFHLNPGNWSVKIGDPSRPLSLSIGENINASGYYMMGDEVLPAPSGGCRSMERSGAESIADGVGVAFGAGFSATTGRQSVPLGVATVYGSAGGSVHVDGAALYAGDACGRSPVGFKGWYATGNAALALNADVGVSWPSRVIGYWAEVKVRVKVKTWKFWEWRVKISWDWRTLTLPGGDVKVWSGSFCESAGFGAPNPTWFEYRRSFDVDVMWGMYRGTVTIPFTIGSKCDL